MKSYTPPRLPEKGQRTIHNGHCFKFSHVGPVVAARAAAMALEPRAPRSAAPNPVAEHGVRPAHKRAADSGHARHPRHSPCHLAPAGLRVQRHPDLGAGLAGRLYRARPRKCLPPKASPRPCDVRAVNRRGVAHHGVGQQPATVGQYQPVAVAPQKPVGHRRRPVRCSDRSAPRPATPCATGYSAARPRCGGRGRPGFEVGGR